MRPSCCGGRSVCGITHAHRDPCVYIMKPRFCFPATASRVICVTLLERHTPIVAAPCIRMQALHTVRAESVGHVTLFRQERPRRRGSGRGVSRDCVACHSRARHCRCGSRASLLRLLVRVCWRRRLSASSLAVAGFLRPTSVGLGVGKVVVGNPPPPPPCCCCGNRGPLLSFTATVFARRRFRGPRGRRYVRVTSAS